MDEKEYANYLNSIEDIFEEKEFEMYSELYDDIL